MVDGDADTSLHQGPDHSTMLLVEDDSRMVDVFVGWLSPSGIKVVVARSRTEAEALADGHYRLAVCDLQIPTRADHLDASADNGLAVIERLISAHPDLHIFVFSGLGQARMGDQGVVNGLRFFNKSELPECLAAVKAMMGKPS